MMEKIRSTSVDSNTSGVNKAGSQEFDPESSTGAENRIRAEYLDKREVSWENPR